MLLVSYCSCIYPIRWSQVLSWEWRCSWSSADRRCSNYIWVINNFIAYWSASNIRDFTVIKNIPRPEQDGCSFVGNIPKWVSEKDNFCIMKKKWNSCQSTQWTTSDYWFRWIWSRWKTRPTELYQHIEAKAKWPPFHRWHFPWMKMHEFCLRFHWSLFVKFKLTKFQVWFR